jgi:hypothetical protein
MSVGVAAVAVTALMVGSAAITGVLGGEARADTTPSSTLYVSQATSCSDSGQGTEAVPVCTLQHAADVVSPGQTVDVESGINKPVTITRSGTQAAPITFTDTGVSRQWLDTGQPTGQPVVTIKDAQYVTISGLGIDHVNGDDAIDVIGSSRITLEGLSIGQLDPTSPPTGSNGISIDGTSSDVTISRTEIQNSVGSGIGIRAEAVAQRITAATNYVAGAGPGIALDGTTGAVVTGNTVVAACNPGNTAPLDALSLTNGTSAVVENNILVSAVEATSTCVQQGWALLADQSSVGSAGGVTADYNLPYTYGTSSDYSWSGTTYDTAAAFSAASGQGAHDVELTAGSIEPLPEGSPGIDSANCDAPGYTGTDLNGDPRARDPLATDASLGHGSCYADRGAFELQDSLSAVTSAPSPASGASGVPFGVAPFTFGETITSPVTSTWGGPGQLHHQLR